MGGRGASATGGSGGGAARAAAAGSTPAASTSAPAGASAKTLSDAFDTLQNRHNLVLLHDLRQALPHLSRTEFDSQLRELRVNKTFTLNSEQGPQRTGNSLSAGLSQAQRDAGINEAGSKFVFISRRDNAD